MEAAADSTWKGYSLAERDRRWAAVRKNAAEADFDCVFVPQTIDGRNLHLSLEQARGTRSDGRYLTQIEGAAVVLPTDGRSAIVVTDRPAGNSWIPEPRSAAGGSVPFGSVGPLMADALLELGMERARIGVSGLGRGRVTHGRAIAGVVNHSSYAEVLRRLPNAKFEDATDVVGFARFVKSDEEIACLKKGAQIAVAGIERMVEVSRPGVPEADAYASVMERMLELGSEYYPLAWYTNPIGEFHPRFEDPPPDRVLQSGYLITNETDAVWGGIVAQELQPIMLGAIPEPWKPVVDLQRDLFYAGLEYMKPGTLFGDLIDYINGMGPARGMDSLMLMHGRGCGDDGPLLTPQDRRAEHIRDVVIQKGNAYVWKPIAYNAEKTIQFSWGCCILIGDKGGEQLVPGGEKIVRREPGLISVT